MMDKQTLREHLEELHAELQQVESLDVSEREMLENLARDVRDVLSREEDSHQHYSSLGDRLREVTRESRGSCATPTQPKSNSSLL